MRQRSERYSWNKQWPKALLNCDNTMNRNRAAWQVRDRSSRWVIQHQGQVSGDGIEKQPTRKCDADQPINPGCVICRAHDLASVASDTRVRHNNTWWVSHRYRRNFSHICKLHVGFIAIFERLLVADFLTVVLGVLCHCNDMCNGYSIVYSNSSWMNTGTPQENWQFCWQNYANLTD
jgi:hypothetical protein